MLATQLKSLHVWHLNSDKESSDEDQAVGHLSPESNTSQHWKRVRTRGGNALVRRRGRGCCTRGRSSRENLTINYATTASPSLSLPPSPSLPLQAVWSPNDAPFNDNDVADIVFHNQAPLSPQAENSSPSSSANDSDGDDANVVAGGKPRGQCDVWRYSHSSFSFEKFYYWWFDWWNCWKKYLCWHDNKYLRNSEEDFTNKLKIVPALETYNCRWILVFFAVLIFMGIIEKPQFAMYWSQDHFLNSPRFSWLIEGAIFEQISRMIHFVDLLQEDGTSLSKSIPF